MSDVAIRVENLSKMYQLGQFGTGTISKDLERFWAIKIKGKEDPFLKVGEINNRTILSESNVVWSLKDINFEIRKGDAVGIIGNNGAGKSTLLKLLSRITSPTDGKIKLRGRVASLLEVGTGFHPELSGRENIYLNGAILGMRKKEIDRKFDEIIDFSGVEKYIDTPVKRYSSGMYVRLAFAVAANLQSDILIVDEVLAVGDAEFQRKCLSKMDSISVGEGRTLLFVSHNIGSIAQLCKKSILLENGRINCFDESFKVISQYNKRKMSETKLQFIEDRSLDIPVQIKKINLIQNNNLASAGILDFKDKIGFQIEVDVREKVRNRGIVIDVVDEQGLVFQNYNVSSDMTFLEGIEIGKYIFKVNFTISFLVESSYSFNFHIANFGFGPDQYIESAIVIESQILSIDPNYQSAQSRRRNRINLEPIWQYEKIF